MPVRLEALPETARIHVRKLGSEEVEERECASEALRELGFAAEPALWEALDAIDPEVRGRAGALLRTLYTRPPYPPVPVTPLGKALQERKITINLHDEPLTALALHLNEVEGLSVAFDAMVIQQPKERKFSIKIPDVVMDDVFRLCLDPQLKQFVVVEDAIIVTGSESRIFATPKGPFWMVPEEARRIESLIAELAGSDASSQSKAADGLVRAGMPALGPLLEAARLYEGAVAERCRVALIKSIEALGFWLVDLPSGADLQVRTASATRTLDRVATIKAEGITLDDILNRVDVPHVMKVPAEKKLYIYARNLKLSTLLKLATRPYALDFTLDGGTIVIDTAANVRAAVQK